MAEVKAKGNKRKKLKKHGYRARKSSAGGRAVLKRRKDKGRVKIA